MSAPVPGGATGTPDGVRERARRNMDRLGIPAGTDNPTLLALGATPLPGATGTPPGAAELADRLESKAVRLADLLEAAALLRSQEAALTAANAERDWWQNIAEGRGNEVVKLDAIRVRLRGVLAFYANPTLYEVRHGWAGISADKGARAAIAAAGGPPTPGDTPPECNGVCLWASDVGVAANVVAYADRACPLHGDSAPVGGDTP